MFLWVCCIFFFHHTALQIVLVLFLWCIKLAHCQLSALCSGSGTKALGQFYFICICCQCNVFILKCPSHINFSGGLTEVEIVKEGALPHCSLQYCFYAFLPLWPEDVVHTSIKWSVEHHLAVRAFSSILSWALGSLIHCDYFIYICMCEYRYR